MSEGSFLSPYLELRSSDVSMPLPETSRKAIDDFALKEDSPLLTFFSPPVPLLCVTGGYRNQ